MEWEESKVIDFVKREDCIRECGPIVCRFYQTLFQEVIDDWDGVFQFEKEIVKERKPSIPEKV
jgi:hypothetical protein